MTYTQKQNQAVDMSYTEKQNQAIHTKSDTVLVSAAAGSGKTRVLTERVLRLVREGADVRHMLIVTFTNAAAAEMRGRIARALHTAAEGADRRLMEQSELAGAADISTFHSFCAGVVRENYRAAEVSPDFKILDEPEAAAIRHRALRELFDLLYEREDDALLLLLARHTNRADDTQLMRMLLRVYGVMMGRPEPYEWAAQSADADASAYIARLKAEYGRILLDSLNDALALMRNAAKIAFARDRDAAGYETDAEAQKTPEAMAARYEADAKTVETLEEMAAYAAEHGVAEAQEKYAGITIPPIRRAADPAVKELTGPLRTEARRELKAFLTDTLYGDFEREAGEQIAHTREDVRALIRLIGLFDRMYAVKKRERNALDYEDLQHKALRVLTRDASLYGEKYRHIFVDEYQDTNPVQEEILKAVGAFGSRLFMVGDVKQSIYKFRLADPGIFRRKAEEYGREDGAGEVILMNDNFRSAERVIGAVNFLMGRVMSERLGEVHYDGGECLMPHRPGGQAQILLCEAKNQPGAEEEPPEEEAGVLPGDRAQAEMIARHIAEGMNEQVEDKETGEPRAARYGDIAILMRSRSALTGEIRRALNARGIPCAVAMKERRDAPEIELFVNLLRVIHNPMRDIPLLSVMRSFIGGMDEIDFARIRLSANDKEIPFCAAAAAYAEKDGTAARLRAFHEKMSALRARCRAESLAEFITGLAEEYDFETYLMAAGEAEKEAFDELLATMAGMIEANGNSLYTLLRGLAEVKKREGSYVQAEGAGPSDSVRVMTIHGAKGLEFPVVYVAGLNKRFNPKDAGEAFLTHPEYGVTASYVDEAKRVKQETAERAVIREKVLRESRSEELRMLYVAMTRARDRLYLTGCVSDLEKQAEKWRALAGRYDSAACMLDWIMAANDADGVEVCVRTVSLPERKESDFDCDAFLRQAAGEGGTLELIRVPRTARVPAKVSVSAVKRAQKREIQSFLIPRREEREITGARLGTLVHGLMEQIVKREGGFLETAAWLLERRIIGEEEYGALVDNRRLAESFLESELYQRVKNSPRVLYEQQFNLRVRAKELGYGAEEDMLVQGILDLAFLEDGAWTLVDYKTDRVTEESAADAAEGYRVQLQLYARALEEITGLPVSHRYLYFMRPGKTMEV